MLLRLLRYCMATGQLDAIFGDAETRSASVERWVKEWELSGAQTKELWGLILDAYQSDSHATYKTTLKYLALHQASDLAADTKLRTRLLSATAITVRSPEVFQCAELSALPIVQKLDSDPTDGPLIKLLHIFARGKARGSNKGAAAPGAVDEADGANGVGWGGGGLAARRARVRLGGLPYRRAAPCPHAGSYGDYVSWLADGKSAKVMKAHELVDADCRCAALRRPAPPRPAPRAGRGFPCRAALSPLPAWELREASRQPRGIMRLPK
jgi:hypothetical protein